MGVVIACYRMSHLTCAVKPCIQSNETSVYSYSNKRRKDIWECLMYQESTKRKVNLLENETQQIVGGGMFQYSPVCVKYDETSGGKYVFFSFSSF